MDDIQLFTFAMDSDVRKLVAVRRTGRQLAVDVRYSGDVVYDEETTRVRNAIDPQLRTDELGVIVEWKQPIISGWDWLTYSRKRRF